MATIKKENNKCWQRNGEIGTLDCGRTKNGAVAMENNMDGRFLKKIKIKLPYHPAISFLSQKN